MAKKVKKRIHFRPLSRRSRLVILPLFGVIGVGVLVLAVITVIVMPRINPGAQRGIGADGFSAFEEKNTTLGIDKVSTKDEVIIALAKKAKSVDDVSTSNVFNYDGNRGQTATFNFIRADNKDASIYVDMMLFKNISTMNAANILMGTAKAGMIQGHPAYYMHAQTIGSGREYRVLVTNGLKVYRFALVQPVGNITINEVSALATLRKIADKSDL